MTNETRRKEEVRQIVYDWFIKITAHAPVEDLLTHFFDNNPTMHLHFPEQDIVGIDAFRAWYSTVVNTYFDQAHVIKNLIIRFEEESAHVEIEVEWSAKHWEPPSPRSSNIRVDAFQNWELRYKRDSGQWGIKSYYVEGLYDVASLRP